MQKWSQLTVSSQISLDYCPPPPGDDRTLTPWFSAGDGGPGEHVPDERGGGAGPSPGPRPAPGPLQLRPVLRQLLLPLNQSGNNTSVSSHLGSYR
jgi:hypothetical protein